MSHHNIAREVEKIAEELGVDRKRSIGEVAGELKVKSHVIRFWEENFPQIKPEIGAGGRRYYYNKQLKILRRIKKFLHEEGYTIAGLKKLLGRKNKDESEKENNEDLQFLVSETPEYYEEEKPRIEIDDFILDEAVAKIPAAKKTKIIPGTKIDPSAKLLDFANLEVPLVDLKVKKEVNQRLQRVRNNLEKIKAMIAE
jgi:DNA-binding transcriptional MerR regulator